MKAARILAWAVAAQVALLAASGTYLFFEYRPNPSAGWFDRNGNLDASVRVEQAIKRMHALDARILVATVLALAVLAVERVGRDRVTTWLLFGVCAAALFTGLLLPWDQLALFAVTVGRNFSGYRPIFDDEVRFVLIGNAEVEPATLSRWLFIHLALGVVAVGGAVRLILTRKSRSDTVPGNGA